MELSFEPAQKEDVAAIAALHALSWQRHYRGVLPDHYLDKEVQQERLDLWQSRFDANDPTMHLILARWGGELIGFSGTFLDKHPQYGAYIDNLHILEEHQGKGWGRILLRQTAEWILAQDPTSKMYLYVFDANVPAILFYERVGGRLISTEPIASPGGVSPLVRLYLWDDPRLVK
ncbi:MAG: GNAT family N-acetyltransferase [Saprospiraceae bacterium]|nr:GNAT family N-acetyltransferase [Saprospiraceae bacterium]